MTYTKLSAFKESNNFQTQTLKFDSDKYTKPSWMLNESVDDIVWIAAKTGYEANSYRSKKGNIIFDRNINKNESLIEDINKNLLTDIRNSLLYLNAKGHVTRSERTNSILLTACDLILHSNEIQSKKNLNPIKSLSEISFEHVKDYLLSFNVERSDFNTYLKIINEKYSSKKEIDWNTLKDYLPLTSRKFKSTKYKIIKHLESNHNNFKSESGYIPRYQKACVKNFDLEYDLAPKMKTISNEISKIQALFTARPSQKYKFRVAAQKLFSSGATLFDNMVEPDRTPLMPVKTALHTLSSALRFVREYGPLLREYLVALNRNEKRITTSVGVRKTIAELRKIQLDAFECTPIPKGLSSLNITSWVHENPVENSKLRDGISVGLAIRLYIGSIWILLASFSGARLTSLLTLKRSCFVQSPIDGLFDLVLRIPKSSESWELEDVQRPIPDLIYDYGLEFSALVSEIEERRNPASDDEMSYLFSRHLESRSLTASCYSKVSNTLDKTVSSDYIGECLDIFIDWIDSPLTDGKRWYARTHHFRRFFAVIYFNFTDCEGLDELSWFLGHADLDQTFHYAEVAPTSEWILEAELTIAKIGSSLDKKINSDNEIRAIIDIARKSSNIKTVIEPLVQKLITEHKEKHKKEVRFCRINGEDIFFYFIDAEVI